MTVDPRITEILARYRRARVEAQAHVDAQSTGGTYTPPAPEATVVSAINTVLPAVIAAIMPMVKSRQISIQAATTAITEISAAVAALAPVLKGSDARAVVIAMFSWAFDAYLLPVLRARLGMFAGIAAAIIKGAALQGLELAFQRLVKPRQ